MSNYDLLDLCFVIVGLIAFGEILVQLEQKRLQKKGELL